MAEEHQTDEWAHPIIEEKVYETPKYGENYGREIPKEEQEEETAKLLEELNNIEDKEMGEEFLPPEAATLMVRLGYPNNKKGPGCIRWRHIDWENKKCTPAEIDIMGSHMLIKGKHTKVLTTLNVEGTVAARDPYGVHCGLKLFEGIFKDGTLPNLRDLNVKNCDLKDDEGARLVHAIRASNCTHEFSVLTMSNNEIADETAKALASGFELKELKIIYIGHNRITDEGAKAFAFNQLKQVDRLEMEDNLLTDEGFELLGKSFATGELAKTHYAMVDSFYFSCYDLRNSGKIVRIGDAIDRLDLSGVTDQGRPLIKGGPVSDSDMIFLCQFLIVPARLIKLDLLKLHTNMIGAVGCAALATAMREGTSDCLNSIGMLHLTNNPIGDMGLKQLCGPIENEKALPNVRDLHLGKCLISDKSMVRLAQAFGAGAMPLMQLLSLGQNKIADEGCTALAKAFRGDGIMPKLTGLYLGTNAIGDEGVEALAGTLALPGSLPSLKQLHLFKNEWTAERGKAAIEMAVRATNRDKLTVDFE